VLVPIVPFLPHAARDPGLFVESPNDHDTLNEFEHRLKRPVDVMLFFFGLVNAGVVFGNFGAGTWFVLIAILIGKPVGILGATALAWIAGLRLPAHVTWRDMTVVGIIAGGSPGRGRPWSALCFCVCQPRLAPTNVVCCGPDGQPACTRFLPCRLAAYSASSARRSRVSVSSPGCHCASPALKCTGTRRSCTVSTRCASER